MACKLCPRECGADRDITTGFCGEKNEIKAARAALHMWEEPCISGENGSGTVFFSGCVLRCVFCQNGNIANGSTGKIISSERLVEIFLELQEKGANNINLVTPTHFVPQIIDALKAAKLRGLNIPIVYNTGSYENVETIRALSGLVDIYLPDLKYFSSELSAKYSKASDYFYHASKAIDEMVKQVGEPTFDENGIMQNGVIVRHLLLPGCVEDSKKVVKYLYEKYGDSIFIGIMNQYTPMPGIGEKYPELNRKITDEEYDELVDYAIELGVENGFIQEGDTALESFIPDFDMEGI